MRQHCRRYGEHSDGYLITGLQRQHQPPWCLPAGGRGHPEGEPVHPPESECTELRNALRSYLGVQADCILFGNGSTELIHLVASARLRRGDPPPCSPRRSESTRRPPAFSRSSRFTSRPPVNASSAGVRLDLLRCHGVCVRDCASFGMPGHIRIGVRGMRDSRRLIDAMRDVSS